MSAIKLATPSSGSISLSPANTASNLTITVPAVTGTMAINGPAFSAYASASQTPITLGVYTKVTFDTEDFDTDSNFASSRFTPTVAGYYQVNATLVYGTTGTPNLTLCNLFKNGSNVGRLFSNASSVQNGAISGSIVVYLNGSTDYIEIYGYVAGTGTVNFSSATSNNTSRFSASMVRAA